MATVYAPEGSVISRINNLLQEIHGEEKSAASLLDTSGDGAHDPGSKGGKSSHPSAKMDVPGAGPATLGERAQENEKDIKEKVPGGGIDSQSKQKKDNQESRQTQVGTKKTSVGDDPDVEHNYSLHQSDPGSKGGPTSHPAKFDKEKYASLSLGELRKIAAEKMNSCLADIATGQRLLSTDTSSNTTTTTETAASAGYDLAQQVQHYQDDVAVKQAFVQELYEQFYRAGEADGDRVGQFLQKYAAAYEEEMANMGAGAGAEPAAAAGGGADAAAAMQAMAAAPGGGGAEAAAPMGAGPAPGGPAPGGAGPEGNPEDALNELINALLELGISPEQLMEVLSAHEKEGKLKIAKEEKEQLTKAAGLARDYQRAGKARIKEAQPGSKERQERDEIKSYIREVCQQR